MNGPMNVSQGGGDETESSVRNGSSCSFLGGGGRSMNTSTTTASKMSFQRSNNHDRVRRVVAEEGLLRALAVPLRNKENKEEEEERSKSGNSRAQKINPGIHKIKKPNAWWAEGKGTTTGAPPPDKAGQERSPTKDRQPRKTDQQPSNYVARCKNLEQDIDEVYSTCDSERSVEKCTEALQLMTAGVRDFEALRDRIQLREKAEKTDARNRPNSLSERKSSPSADTSPKVAGGGAPNFGGVPSTPAAAAHHHLSHTTTGPSWADRVKSSPSLPVNTGSSSSAYPAKPPSSAAVVACKVNPAVVVFKSKDAVPVKDSHPHYEPHHQRVQLPCWPQDNVRAHPLSGGQLVPVELASLQPGAGRSDRGRATEPLGERVRDAGHCGGASRADTPSRNSAPTPPQTTACPWAPSSAPTTAPPPTALTPPVMALSLSPDLQPRTESSRTLLAQGDRAGLRGGATSVPGQAEAPMTVGMLWDSTEFFTLEPDDVPAKKEAIAVRLEWPDEDAVVGSILEEEQLTTAIQAEHSDLERRNEEAIASAIAEEEQLTREIQAENDYLERANEEVIAVEEDQLAAGETQIGDAEEETDNESDFSASVVSGGCGLNMDWNDIVRDYEAREPWRQSMSWGDIVEREPSRPPGHDGIYMHEKFSNPLSRRSSFIATSARKCEERQLNAQQNRDKIREEKTLHLQRLHDRHTVVREHREALLEERRRIMEEKHSKAEFKRELHLHAIVRKAQEEDAKVNEIAVINMLEAQNKRHDARVKRDEYEQRLVDQAEERHRRQEEKHSKDRAVQERKRALEVERQAKLREMLARRTEQQRRVEQQRQDAARAREDAARERARDQGERMAALSAAQQEATEELQKKIRVRCDGSSRRHMEQLQQRKEKAAELSSGVGGGKHANAADHHHHAPRLTPYERRKRCTLCDVEIASEVHLLGHTRGKRHQQAVRDSSSIQGRELSEEEVEHLSLRKYIGDAAAVAAADAASAVVSSESTKDREERQKARRAKKLRAKMNSRSRESEMAAETTAAAAAAAARNVPVDSPSRDKLQRLVKDVAKQLQAEGGRWVDSATSGVNRNLGEISRILEKRHGGDQVAFRQAGGFSALELLLRVVTSAASAPATAPSSSVRLKSLCAAVNAYYLACSGCPPNCSYNFFSNKIALLMDLLLHQLKLYAPGEDESLATALLQTSAALLEGLDPQQGPGDDTKAKRATEAATESFNTHARDVVSYAVSTGLIDRLSGCFLSVQGPVDERPKSAAFLQQASALLRNMCTLCFAATGRRRTAASSSGGIFGDDNNKRRDPTGLSALLRATDLAGVVHALYCVLLHDGSPPRPESSSSSSSSASAAARVYPPSVAAVALQGVRFVNSCALLDLSAFQAVLGAEGLSLAFRHIVSSLLAYCCCCSSQQQSSCCSDEELLNEVIVCVGYFTVDNPDNQATVVQSSGGVMQPSVLQMLCQLPVRYFFQPSLMKVLFPSLITACYDNPENKLVLQQEMSCVWLATFIQDCSAASSGEKNDGRRDEATKRGDGGANGTGPRYCELSDRFPRDQWDLALRFFQQK